MAADPDGSVSDPGSGNPDITSNGERFCRSLFFVTGLVRAGLLWYIVEKRRRETDETVAHRGERLSGTAGRRLF